ncbi:LysR family transcriptional regulator [Lysobacter gummosus]|uniref:LysR family transcriptional regulator n=1 Tax=Lysobacter gummosus TaxID=262324 RepID=A0ABY3XEL5_9GAMM|nr:LysR family transcriptional regulator [Lysobacter gummosus]ALN89522.1 bacterial regulatory helix-turn-helix, lysR family protein [Lysobacter gummosus]UNP30162.1 LysR family transcriptional regulator [Lysobacter gummosus]
MTTDTPSPRRLPPLRALQAFAAVVRYDGMRRAAERMHLSHAALSQHVQHLEEAFGLRLLDRSGGRARPTPLGREYGEALIAGFEQIEAATARLRLRGDESRRLVLGAPTSLSVSLLLPRIDEFSAQAGFDLQLFCPASAPDLAQARVHALLMHGDPRAQGLQGELLFEQALVPVASPELIARMDSQRWWLEPAPGVRVLHVVSEGWRQDWPAWFGDDLAAWPLPQLSLSSPMPAISAALAGQGIALLYPRLIAGRLASGELQVLASPRPGPVKRLYLAWLPEAGGGARLGWVRDWLLGLLRGEAAG